MIESCHIFGPNVYANGFLRISSYAPVAPGFLVMTVTKTEVGKFNTAEDTDPLNSLYAG